MRSDLVHETVIIAAYDKRAESNGKYGQHCCDMCFYVKGPLGVVQFQLYTGWYCGLIGKPETPWQELHVNGRDHQNLSAPMPADLGYHSPTPRYEDHRPMDCHLLPEGKCYYDGSTLNADWIFSIMIHRGGDAMWEELEGYYADTFEEVAPPEISTDK